MVEKVVANILQEKQEKKNRRILAQEVVDSVLADDDRGGAVRGAGHFHNSWAPWWMDNTPAEYDRGGDGRVAGTVLHDVVDRVLVEEVSEHRTTTPARRVQGPTTAKERVSHSRCGPAAAGEGAGHGEEASPGHQQVPHEQGQQGQGGRQADCRANNVEDEVKIFGDVVLSEDELGTPQTRARIHDSQQPERAGHEDRVDGCPDQDPLGQDEGGQRGLHTEGDREGVPGEDGRGARVGESGDGVP